ncbi:MAG: hypothetical protein K8R37_04325 [Bacteroidales bacterium]|nr:hypothetical protein [Bacteroidales bacterium]
MKTSSQTNWNKLQSLTDSQIDYSDISETNSEFWSDAEILLPHKKVVLKINVDEDIAIWLKQFDDKYNNTVNRILRSHFSTYKQLIKKQHTTL